VPFLLTTQGDRDRARRVQAAWVAYVGGDPGAKDLARVLRVPGSRNLKYDPPRPVGVLRADYNQLYNLPDLETLSRPAERPAPAAVIGSNGRGPSEDAADYWFERALDEYERTGQRNESGKWLALQLRDNGVPNGEAVMLAYQCKVRDLGDHEYTEAEALATWKSINTQPARGPARSAAARVNMQAPQPTAKPPAGLAYPDEPPDWIGNQGGTAPQPANSTPAPDQALAEDQPPAPSGGPADTPALRQIFVTNRPMPAVTAEAIDALAAFNDPPSLFMRSGRLARVRTDEKGRPIIDNIDAPVLRGRMARAALWYKVLKTITDERGNRKTPIQHVPPPDEIVQDALALGAWPFPGLEAITETPALRPDGSVLDRPGFDPATGLYYVPARGFHPPAIPDNPTAAELQAAVNLIDEAIGDFPYTDPASRANAFALLLTPILRPAIIGNTPLALLDAPQAGTGKSLLAETVSILATGRQAAMMSAATDEAEWDKRITALLLEGATVITVDNIEAILQSASLASALTSTTVSRRILGQSVNVNLPQRATWLATGNNIRLGGDMPRRCYWIRLDAQTAQPWRRQDFRHPGLIGWVSENRGQLLGALLTIARSWWIAGRPAATVTPLGSFEDWTRKVGGVLAHAGITGFLGNLDELYDRVDEEGQQWQRFLTAWHETLGDNELTVKELLKRLENGLADPAKDPGGAALVEALPDWLADGLTDPKRSTGFSRKLGKALAKRADMTFDETGLRLTNNDAGKGTGKTTLKWRVVRARK